MLEDVVRKGRLLDIYGPLLTERQCRCMEMYFLLDLSLAEIGEELDISRQGVYDMLNRASKSLEHYEEKLHLLARQDDFSNKLDKVMVLLEQGEGGQVEQAKEILHTLEI